MFNQTAPPEEGAEEKQLTHHAVVNILTFIGRWREILIEPCFTDSVALTTQIHPHIDRISGVRSRIPVKLNTITINGFNIENFDLLRFPTGKRNHRLNAFWCGSFQITTNEIDGKTTRPFFGIVFTGAQPSGKPPMPVRVAITRANGQ